MFLFFSNVSTINAFVSEIVFYGIWTVVDLCTGEKKETRSITSKYSKWTQQLSHQGNISLYFYLSLSLSLPLCLFSLFLSLSPSLSFALSLPFSLFYSFYLSFYLSFPFSLSLHLSTSLTLLSLSLSLSLSLFHILNQNPYSSPETKCGSPTIPKKGKSWPRRRMSFLLSSSASSSSKKLIFPRLSILHGLWMDGTLNERKVSKKKYSEHEVTYHAN